MTDGVEIRRLGPDDAAAYSALRREMLLDTPAAFGSVPGEDWYDTPESAREEMERPEGEIFAAVGEDGALLSVVGLKRQTRTKRGHCAFVWGVYTTPAARGQGLGGRVLDAVLEFARSLDGVELLQLSVSTDTPGAQRVYERAGFVPWGREPRSMRLGDRRIDEVHMWRPL
ncbi:MAG: GNAT family N-acetyltransferase [Planctomycetota bacterium]